MFTCVIHSDHHARQLIGLLVAFLLVLPLSGYAEAANVPGGSTDVMAQHLVTLGVAKTGYAIVINIPSFRLFLYRNGSVVKSYPIAVGKVVSPSTLGTVNIINKVVNPTYYPPDWAKKGLKPIPPGPENPVGTRWLGLSIKGYGIHGTNNPASIGRAASAGCIRMYNADVEELGKLVPVGTPVTFRYEQVAVGFAAELQQIALQVLPDIYGQGTPSVNSVLERIKKAGVQDPLNEQALRQMLNHKDAQLQLLPFEASVLVENYGQVRGYRVNGKQWVMVSELAQVLGETWAIRSGASVSVFGQTIREAWTDAGVGYAPIDVVASSFGIPTPSDATLRPITLLVGTVQLRLYLAGSDLLLPLNAMATALGLSIGWDNQTGVPLVDNQPVVGARMLAGRSYLPITEAQASLGVRVVWHPGMATAQIRRPMVLLAGQSAEGFWRDGALWFPLRPLTEAIGVPLTWDSTQKVVRLGDQTVHGALWGGRLYAPNTDLLTIFPQLYPVWHEDELTLEYTLPVPAAN